MRQTRLQMIFNAVAALALLAGCTTTRSRNQNTHPATPVGYRFNADKEPTLYAIATIDNRNVWAVGQYHTVLRSVDSGDTWTSVHLHSDVDFTSITVLPDASILVFGMDGTVLKSGNSGQSWNRIATPFESSIGTSSRVGTRVWIAGNSGLVGLSSDGGATWQSFKTGVSENLESISATSDGKSVWAVGTKGTLVFSDNGGTGWEKRAPGVTADLHCVYSNDTGSLVLIGGDNGLLLRSTNSGKSWEQVDKPEPAAHVGLLTITGSNDGSNLFVAGVAGLVLESRDFGKSWRLIDSPTNRAIWHTTYLNGTTWYVGNREIILRGHESNAPGLVYGNSYDLQALYRHSATAPAYGLGAGGFIGQYDVLKKQWSMRRSSTYETLLSMTETATGIIAVGTSGAITKTRDMHSFTRVDSHTSNTLLFVTAFSDHQHLIAVGDHGTVETSKDAGATWVSRTLQPDMTEALRSVHTFGSRAWAVGKNGLLLSSDDYGATWQSHDSGTDQNLTSLIGSPDGKRLYVFGATATVLLSSDAGLNWDELENGFDDDLAAAACIDNECNHLLAVGQDGLLVRIGPSQEASYETVADGNLVAIVPDQNGGLALNGRDDIKPISLSGQKVAASKFRVGKFKGIWTASAHEGPVWRVGNNGNVERSDDWGETWAPQQRGVTAQLWSVTGRENTSEVWAVGAAGSIAYFNGKDWRLEHRGTLTYWSVRACEQKVWVAAQSGKLLVGDGPPSGLIEKDLRTQHAFTAVDVDPSCQIVVAADIKGQVLVSNDGGVHWKARTAVSAQLNDVRLLSDDGKELVAVGGGGTIALSRDSGEHWAQTSVGSDSLYAVVPDRRHHQIFAVGANGNFYQSGDWGETWTNTSIGYGDDLWGIAELGDAEKLLVVGDMRSPLPGYSRGGQVDVRDVTLSHHFGSLYVQGRVITMSGIASASFSIHASRSDEYMLGKYTILPLVSTYDGTTGTWRWDIDTSSLRGAGSSYRLSLCVENARCIYLADVTIVPVFDFQKHKPWAVPVVIVISVLFSLFVVWLLSPLKFLTISDAIVGSDSFDRLEFSGSKLLKSLLRAFFLPYLALHRRTQDAWVRKYRAIVPVYMQVAKTPEYISLPIQVQALGASTLVSEPSPAALSRIQRDTIRVVEIVGPGGIGKTTLLNQLERWLLTDYGSNLLIGHPALPVRLGELDTLTASIAAALKRATGRQLTVEFINALLQSGRIVLIIDGVTEKDEGTKRRLRALVISSEVGLAFITGRAAVVDDATSSTTIMPLPLTSTTLLHFMTSLLSQTRSVELSMQEQLQLGARLAELIGPGLLLTPLLVKVYLERALELYARTGQLEGLPKTIPDAYFEFIRHWISGAGGESWAKADVVLRVLGDLAVLSVAEHLTPQTFRSTDAVEKVNNWYRGSTESLLQGLVEGGLLLSESSGPLTLLRFALDPLAEFIAAYQLAEECGASEEKWSALFQRIDDSGVEASGFRRALELTIAAYVERRPWSVPIERRPLRA